MTKLYMSTEEVELLTKIPDHLLYHWITANVIQPARPGIGSGSRHAWSAENVFILKILSLLRRQINDTIILTRVRRAIQARNPTDEVVVIHGNTVWCSSYAAIPFDHLQYATVIVRLDNP